MAYIYYQKTIWLKENETFDFNELGNILARYFNERYNGKISVEQQQKSITISKKNWKYYLRFNDAHYVLAENQEIFQFTTVLNPYQNEINPSFRIEAWGDDDPDMDYFNDTLNIEEFIAKEYDCIIYDPQANQILEPMNNK